MLLGESRLSSPEFPFFVRLKASSLHSIVPSCNTNCHDQSGLPDSACVHGWTLFLCHLSSACCVQEVRHSSCIYDMTRLTRRLHQPWNLVVILSDMPLRPMYELCSCQLPKTRLPNFLLVFKQLRQCWCGHRALQRPATSPAASYKMRMEANMKALVYDDALDVPNASQCHKLSSLITVSVMPIIWLQSGRLQNHMRHVLSGILITGSKLTSILCQLMAKRCTCKGGLAWEYQVCAP